LSSISLSSDFAGRSGGRLQVGSPSALVGARFEDCVGIDVIDLSKLSDDEDKDEYEDEDDEW